MKKNGGEIQTLLCSDVEQSYLYTPVCVNVLPGNLSVFNTAHPIPHLIHNTNTHVQKKSNKEEVWSTPVWVVWTVVSALSTCTPPLYHT